MTNYKICAYEQTIVAAAAEPLYRCSESFIHWLILVTPKEWLFTLLKLKKKNGGLEFATFSISPSRKCLYVHN